MNANATARHERSRVNCGFVRNLLRQRQPALAAALDAAVTQGIRDSMPVRGCGTHHAGECTSEFPYTERT
jgi:hypothetical protein